MTHGPLGRDACCYFFVEWAELLSYLIKLAVGLTLGPLEKSTYTYSFNR